jgi:glutaredoxin
VEGTLSAPARDIGRDIAMARMIVWLGVLAALAGPGLAQRRNDPANCPYCKNDPALMEAAGIASHGGFAFGKSGSDTASVDRLLATSDIRWIESKHFEIGIALGTYKVKQDEVNKIRAEMERLAVALPSVPKKPKSLDPWLRAHLYAQRLEDIWNRFLELMQIQEKDFPDGSAPWNMQGKYMGEGPYVGQKGKYEVLILPNEASCVTYLKDQFGLLVKMTQRWNQVDLDTISVTIHTQQGQLNDDQGLHGHVAFNQTVNLLDGYKHYSYETPVWIREGLAHFVERELNPKYNTFDSSEGAVADMTRKENWQPEVRKLVTRGEAPRMAELIALRDYSELRLPHHYTTWSMTEYMVKTNPAGYACLNDGLHGITNAKGIPDGSNLPDVHRDKFKECFGMSYSEFDAAWAAWVMETYSSQ